MMFGFIGSGIGLGINGLVKGNKSNGYFCVRENAIKHSVRSGNGMNLQMGFDLPVIPGATPEDMQRIKDAENITEIQNIVREVTSRFEVTRKEANLKPSTDKEIVDQYFDSLKNLSTAADQVESDVDKKDESKSIENEVKSKVEDKKVENVAAPPPPMQRRPFVPPPLEKDSEYDDYYSDEAEDAPPPSIEEVRAKSEAMIENARLEQAARDASAARVAAFRAAREQSTKAKSNTPAPDLNAAKEKSEEEEFKIPPEVMEKLDAFERAVAAAKQKSEAQKIAEEKKSALLAKQAAEADRKEEDEARALLIARQAEEMVKQKAEVEAQRIAEEEARALLIARQAEEMVKQKAEAEAQRIAEEEARALSQQEQRKQGSQSIENEFVDEFPSQPTKYYLGNAVPMSASTRKVLADPNSSVEETYEVLRKEMRDFQQQRRMKDPTSYLYKAQDYHSTLSANQNQPKNIAAPKNSPTFSSTLYEPPKSSQTGQKEGSLIVDLITELRIYTQRRAQLDAEHAERMMRILDQFNV